MILSPSLLFPTLVALVLTSPAIAQAPVQFPFFLNAGGPEYVDSEGNTWIADDYYNSTILSYSNTNTNMNISDTPDPALYYTQRWARSNITMSDPFRQEENPLQYNIPVESGAYDVTLHFIESYFGDNLGPEGDGTGFRNFNVYLEDELVIENLDINARFGYLTPVIHTFTTSVDDGLLTIKLVGNIENPKINAIHITPTVFPIYINAGGGNYTDKNNITWDEDSYFLSGRTATYTGSITETVDDELYQTERYMDQDTQLQYEFPRFPAGEYEVTLHFAETYSPIDAIGDRVFNVYMENRRVFPDIDIYAEAGGSFIALNKSATVTVEDGTFNLDFARADPYAQQPTVSAISIIAVTA